MKRLVLPLSVVALSGTLLIGGCDFLQSDTEVKVEDNSPVLAIVNGVNITQKDLDSAVSQLPPNVQAMPIDQLREPLMNTLIETELLAAEGRTQGLGDSQDFLHSIERFKVFSLREANVARVQDEAVTDAALQAAYDEQVQADELTKEVSASHILLDTEEEALAVIAELQGGADFATLAQERSIGPSSESGGSLGFFKKNAMVEPFAIAAFAMEVGAFSATPVQTQFGWHVIKVDDVQEVDAPPFQSMRVQLEPELRQKAMEDHIEGLRSGATIELKYETTEEPAEDDHAEEPAEDDHAEE